MTLNQHELDVYTVDLAESSESAEDAERRRPGRAELANPHLIPLLRQPETLDWPTLPDFPEYEDTRPPLLGIGVAVVLSVPIWAVIGTIIWLAQ